MERKTLELRYTEALRKIGYENISNLPEQVKEILKKESDLETKVKMLELVADYI